jgi:uncharacterized protein YecE (DUF72 family)
MNRLFFEHESKQEPKLLPGFDAASLVKGSRGKIESGLKSQPAFDREWVKAALGGLAGQGVYIGTSSWKYPGWRGLVYDENRYMTRGKVAESRFERECLAEYAEVFKTVCVDAAYYRFPDQRYLESMMSQVPADFQFSFKVTDDITLKRFTKLPRFGLRAGKANENFLNADLFAAAFVRPLEPFKRNVGLFMFEFSKFYPGDYEHGRDFVADLDQFLGNLPRGWPYGVEIRNKFWLRADYFEVLRKHGVAHVYNSWTDMPPVSEQMALAGSRTSGKLRAARFLLKPGRKYEQAVNLFKPYDEIKDPYPDGRAAGAALVKEGVAAESERQTFIYVNNRLEGNALETIAGMLEAASE